MLLGEVAHQVSTLFRGPKDLVPHGDVAANRVDHCVGGARGADDHGHHASSFDVGVGMRIFKVMPPGGIGLEQVAIRARCAID